MACLSELNGTKSDIEWKTKNNFLVNKDSLEGFLDNFIRNITKNAPIAIKAAKKSINASFIDLGFKIEREQYIKTLNSKDRNEGLSSFKNKTIPNWKNK